MSRHLLSRSIAVLLFAVAASILPGMKVAPSVLTGDLSEPVTPLPVTDTETL